MRKPFYIVAICLVILLVFTGCGVLKKIGLLKDNDEATPVSSIVLNEEEAKKLADKIPVRLYFTNNDNSKLFLEIRYIPMEEAKKSTSALATAIVEELIKGPTKSSGLKPTIPEGTKLLQPVSVENTVATVNLSKEFVDNHPGGKAAERMTIYSIVNSLTELVDIHKVEFLIEGKTREEYKGSFQFNMPFPRNEPLISKEPLRDVPTVEYEDAGSMEDNAQETDVIEGEAEDVINRDGEAEEVINEEGEAEDVITDEGEAEEVISEEEISEEVYLEVLE